MKNENNIGSNENDRENVNIMKENEHPADTGGGTPGEKKLNDRRIILYLAFTFIGNICDYAHGRGYGHQQSLYGSVIGGRGYVCSGSRGTLYPTYHKGRVSDQGSDAEFKVKR